MSTAQELFDEDFSSRDFYLQQISIDTVLADSPFLEIIHSSKLKDELAAHLACSPTYLVMHRRLEPEKNSYYVVLFDGKIQLKKWQLDVYRRWYPVHQVLLYAPTVPEWAWLKRYLSTGETVKKRFF